jgi:hypothetical protein
VRSSAPFSSRRARRRTDVTGRSCRSCSCTAAVAGAASPPG